MNASRDALVSRAAWCINTGRVANRELGRMPKKMAVAWACKLATFRGDWAQTFSNYMRSIQPKA